MYQSKERSQKKHTKHKSFRTKHPIDYSKHLPDIYISWTHTDRALYNLIYSFSVNGCWMSNATLAHLLHRCRRSIQLSRKHLSEGQAIIMARTNPRTWSMWSRYHPAVRSTPILYFRGGDLPNIYYISSGAQNSGAQKQPAGENPQQGPVSNLSDCGAQKLRPEGAIFAPKREEQRESLQDSCSKGFPSKERPAAEPSLSQGATPPEPPGGSGNHTGLNRWQKNRLEQLARHTNKSQFIDILNKWRWSAKQVDEACDFIFSEP